ncbi:acetyltransferase [Pyrus ussuriensis x Pyrus communis]|uniref:Acetyltransferase n=1 Tax=Pyrus ussuriensis x Pyrus communis TaxID=2448454 RepID=A0A5N5HQ17_9ROSA|nr:acetyltransferase [Pyrus ussuriensis x Pyrus communis]
MFPVEIMCRVSVFTPAQMFPTPPLSLCCMSGIIWLNWKVDGGDGSGSFSVAI